MTSREHMMADLTARSRKLEADPAGHERAMERQRVKRLELFEQEHAGFTAWAQAGAASGFQFATDMLAKVRHGHAMTPPMVAAIDRCIRQEAERAEQRAADQFRAQELARPVHHANLDAVAQAFARAKAAGIKWPKLVLDGFKLAPAGENSRNAGAIYVTQGDSRDGLYLGRVMRGEFLPARECDEPTRDKVLEAMADPLASAIAYGKKYGRCSICKRELTDEDSIERGIGPVCAEKYGWA
jgi:hypothetical protein